MKVNYRILLSLFLVFFYQATGHSYSDDDSIELLTTAQKIQSAKAKTNLLIDDALNPISPMATIFRVMMPIPFDWALSIIDISCDPGKKIPSSRMISIGTAVLVSTSFELLYHFIKRTQMKVTLNLLPTISETDGIVLVPREDFLKSYTRLNNLKIGCSGMWLCAVILPFILGETDTCDSSGSYQPNKLGTMYLLWFMAALWNTVQEYYCNYALSSSLSDGLSSFKGGVFGPPIPSSPSLWSRIKGCFVPQGDKQPLLG
jgi:hypothetical protein